MLELQDGLATWELLTSLEPNQPLQQHCRRLADHRKAYLDYEGEVSSGRGNVSQVASGTFQTVVYAPDIWELKLNGEAKRDGSRTSLQGRLVLCVNSICSLNQLSIDDLTSDSDNEASNTAPIAATNWALSWSPDRER